MSLVIYIGVQDFQNLVLGLTVNLDRRWWRLYSIWDYVWYGGFELGDMEYGMDGVHGVRELEHKGVGASLCNDCIWPKVLLRELL